MKKLFKLLLVAILLGGWALAASALYLVRAPGRLAGIPRTEWAGKLVLIPKDCMGWRDTYVDTSRWTPTDLANHPVVVQRIKESGRKDLISHITEQGLADAGKAEVGAGGIEVKPAAAVAPVEEKQEKSIFDFPEKK
ncbi:MAG TPA: hypothetical protein VGQ99_14640 [Tepidisphaeraceae bacterium]|jgi:hypothetical protein|nr:hypothetical protein [Tepidisphaeraceae bacterium]